MLLQFFLETFIIVCLGGLAGVALGSAACLALGQLQVPDLIPVPEVSLRIVAIALSVMAMIGVGAGVVPAWRAAQVDPSVTLRME